MLRKNSGKLITVFLDSYLRSEFRQTKCINCQKSVLNILNGFLWVEFEIIYWAKIGSFTSSEKIRWIIFCSFSARMRWSNTFTDFTARVSRTRAKFFGPRKTDLSIKQRKARKRGQVSCGIQRISYLLFPRARFWRYFRSESKKRKNRLCYPTRKSVENFRIFSKKLFGF